MQQTMKYSKKDFITCWIDYILYSYIYSYITVRCDDGLVVCFSIVPFLTFTSFQET